MSPVVKLLDGLQQRGTVENALLVSIFFLNAFLESPPHLRIHLLVCIDKELAREVLHAHLKQVLLVLWIQDEFLHKVQVLWVGHLSIRKPEDLK